MDLRAVLLSPLFWLVVLLAVISTVSEVKGTVAPIMKLPIHPRDQPMLGFFRISLFQFALIVIVFYSALLMHREREHRLHEILGASPYPDWVILISKVLTLCLVILLLLLASMLVCIGLQAMAGPLRLRAGRLSAGPVRQHGLLLLHAGGAGLCPADPYARQVERHAGRVRRAGGPDQPAGTGLGALAVRFPDSVRHLLRHERVRVTSCCRRTR